MFRKMFCQLSPKVSAKKLSNVHDITFLKKNNSYIIIITITYIAYKKKLNILFQLNVFRLVIMF